MGRTRIGRAVGPLYRHPSLLLLCGITAVVLTTAAGLGQQKPVPDESTRADLALFASPIAVLDANEFLCILTNGGSICDQVFNSPFSQGGIWPTGSPNGYVFNSGLQVAGIIGSDGGQWAGDTTGAFLFDPSGRNNSGVARTDLFDSTEPDDLAAWPVEARIPDNDLFHAADIGRTHISSQDSWVRYWEGDPTRLNGRPHPLGISISQRSLAWNYPSGNESVIYFVFDIKNVSSDVEFQALNEAAFFGGDADALPATGYKLNELYVGLAADMDVTVNAGENSSTAVLPFDLSITYHGGFQAPRFVYSPQLFYPPFFTAAPGIVAVEFLKTPAGPAGKDLGMTMWSAYGGSATGFPSPRETDQLWRYFSGNINFAQGDFPCFIPAEVVNSDPTQVIRSVCSVFQSSNDSRYAMSTGPFSLGPGESETIVVAYMAAPTVETMPDGSPSGISANDSDANANRPGVPSFHPGFPSARGCTDTTATNCSDVDLINEVKAIERGAGWVAYSGPAPATALESPDQALDPALVEVIPHSLLHRARVARELLDAKFQLPEGPIAPEFHLLPGDGVVTVVWEPSPTEELGDPFFELANNPQSSLFNPNYRQFDVAGYEIWRGTSPDNLVPIRVFLTDVDYVDTTCETVKINEDIGNPVGTGYAIGEPCPDGFVKSLRPFGVEFNNGSTGGRPGRGVVRAATGGAALVQEFKPLPLPEWTHFRTGVPFVFRDTIVTNNFAHFYTVRAFDFNSPASGPPVQRSVELIQSVIPRSDSPNLVNAALMTFMSGDDGIALDPKAPFPEVDESSGVFSGPMPPTDAYSQSFEPLVPRLLPQLSLQVTIDSIRVEATGNLASGTQEFAPSASGLCTPVGPEGKVGSHFGACWNMYLTTDFDGMGTQMVAPGYNPWWDAFGGISVFDLSVVAATVPFDPKALDAFGIPPDSGFATAEVKLGEAISMTAAEGAQNRRFGNFHTGARWFDGNSATGAVNMIEDPSKYRRVGHLSGIDTVWAPISHTPIDAADEATVGSVSTSNGTMFEKQCFNRGMAFLDRAADIVFTWSSGTVTARDVVHNVPVAFNPRAGPTWGFLTTDSNGNGVLDWHDFNYIDGALEIIRQVDGGACNTFAGGATRFDAGLTATPVNLASSPRIMPTSTEINTVVDLENGAALPQTGSGFGLYVNGHRFIFETSSVPADGTEWTLRTFYGNLTTRNTQSQPDDPGGYRLTKDAGSGWAGEGFTVRRPMLIPGLTFHYDIASSGLATGPAELEAVHTVPDPYFFLSEFDGGGPNKLLVFVNLPPRATIRIYSLTGILVDVIDHDDPTAGGRAPWDLRNRGGRFAASGVYFFHVVTPKGDERVGKFTIINPGR